MVALNLNSRSQTFDVLHPGSYDAIAVSILEGSDRKPTSAPNDSAWRRLESLTKQVGAFRTLRALVASGFNNNPEKMAKALGIAPDELEQLLKEVHAERPDIFGQPKP